MLREVVMFLCAAGIVSASITHPSPAAEDNQPSQTSVAVSSEVSSSQPQQDIPVEAKILQSQLAANAQQAPTFTNEQVAQYPESSSGVHAYVARPDLRYSISPAIVNALPEPVPEPEANKVESHQQVTDVKESSVPVPVAQPVQNEVQSAVNRPTVQFVSAPVEQSQVVQTIGENSSNAFQETVTDHHPSAVYASSALPQFFDHAHTIPLRPSFQYAPIPVSYTHPGLVKTVSFVPKKKVTIETHQSVTAHPQTVNYVTPRPVVAQPIYYQPQLVAKRPVVEYVSAPFEHRYPAFQTVTANPQPAPLSINEFKTVYMPAVHTSHIKPVFVRPAIPAPSKSVTIESHQSVTAHPPSPVAPIQHVQTFTASPPVQHRYPAFQTVSAFPPSAAYVTPAPAPIPIREVITASKAAVHVSPVKPVFVRPVAPAPSKSVTIESHQSVTAHPPTPVVPIRQVQTFAAPPGAQYVAAAAPPAIATEGISFAQYGGNSFVKYAPPAIVSRPIPVPVIYSPGAPQFIAVPKLPQPAPAIVSFPSPVTVTKPIPVPVAYPKNEAFIKYNPGVDTSLVYSKSLVEKNHASADLVSTHITPGHGYARALSYSPSSAVSSVSFNGLGVSYGW